MNKAPEALTRIGCFHKMFPDQETPVARVTQFPYNHRIGDTAFGYQHRLLREQANHPERLFQIGHKTAQVTVVDADKVIERRDIIRLPLIVQLQQDIQLQLMCPP